MKITGKMCIAFCEAAGLAVSMEQFDKGFRAAMEASSGIPDHGVSVGERWRLGLTDSVCTVSEVISRKSKDTGERAVYVRYTGRPGFSGKVSLDSFLKFFKREEKSL